MHVLELFSTLYKTTPARLDVVSFAHELYMPELLAVEDDELYLVGLGTVNGKYALAQPRLKIVDYQSAMVVYVDVVPLNLKPSQSLNEDQIIYITTTARAMERTRRSTFRECVRCRRLKQAETIDKIHGEPVCWSCQSGVLKPEYTS